MAATEQDRYRTHITIAGIIILSVLYVVMVLIQSHLLDATVLSSSAKESLFSSISILLVILTAYPTLYGHRAGWIINISTTVYILEKSISNYFLFTNTYRLFLENDFWLMCEIVKLCISVVLVVLNFMPWVQHMCLYKPKQGKMNVDKDVWGIMLYILGVITCLIAILLPWYVPADDMAFSIVDLVGMRSISLTISIIPMFTTFWVAVTGVMTLLMIINRFPKREVSSMIAIVSSITVVGNVILWFDQIFSYNVNLINTLAGFGCFVLAVGGAVCAIGAALVLNSTRYDKPDTSE